MAAIGTEKERPFGVEDDFSAGGVGFEIGGDGGGGVEEFAFGLTSVTEDADAAGHFVQHVRDAIGTESKVAGASAFGGLELGLFGDRTRLGIESVYLDFVEAEIRDIEEFVVGGKIGRMGMRTFLTARI